MAQTESSSTPALLFLNSNKDKRLVAVDGYIYVKNKSTSKVCYWVCEEKSCPAGVHLTPEDQFIKFTKSNHKHLPVPERIEIRKMMTQVKARVNNESAPIGQIYREELSKANLSKAALAMAAKARSASRRKIFCLHELEFLFF
jgi:hypothetical protein